MKPTALSLRHDGAPRVAPRRRATRLRAGVTTIAELSRTLVANGRWWMIPMIAILGLTSLLLVAIAAIEYVAPFVYTIF